MEPSLSQHPCVGQQRNDRRLFRSEFDTSSCLAREKKVHQRREVKYKIG
jgi:hypothetical protein